MVRRSNTIAGIGKIVMHSFSGAEREVAGDNRIEARSPDSTSAVGNSAPPGEARARPVALPIACAIVLITAIAAGTSALVFHFRDRALADTERELSNIALILAEQSDRAFQAVELVQKSLIEQMRSRGITSSEDYERQMSGQDVHMMLKDRVSALPHVDAVTMINSEGKLINFSRYWPIPAVNVADRDYFNALKSNAQLTSFVGEPVLNRVTGTWTIHLARKFTGPNGEFLGLVLGAMQMQYFERFFGTIALGADGAISVFRRDGMLLVRHPRRDAPGTSYARGDLFKNVLSHADRGAVRLISIIDGKERLIASHSLAHYPVVVAVGTTVAAALADWQEEARVLIGAGVLAAFVIVAFAFLIGRRLLRRHEQSEQRLGKQTLKLDTALNNMSQGLLMFDSDGRLVLYNQRLLQMYRLSPDAVKPGCTLSDLLRLRKAAGTFKGDPDRYVAKLVDADGNFKGDPDRQMARMFDEGKVETKVMELPDGRTVSIINQSMPGGGWVSTHEDITERRRAELERDRNREFLDLVIENVPSTIVVTDARDFRYVLINRAGEQYYGIPRDEMIGRTAHDVLPKASADLVTGLDQQVLEKRRNAVVNEHALETPGHGTRIAMSKRLPIFDDKGEPRYLLAVVDDITEQKRAEGQIVHMAHHDALTDLPNRRHFAEQLEQALRRVQRGERLAVLYIDLDHFKRVNDTHGHAIGDELLKDVAHRLRGCVREIDLIARLSGDEFAVIQTSLEQPSDAAALATRIREAIKAPYDFDGRSVVVDSSIGISIAPNDSTVPDELLKSADIALYEAKTSGRGIYCFYEPEMDARIKARGKLELDLRKALVSGEFELFYQPIVNLQNNKISACEALLRWHHPERSMMLPSEFIPVAEEIGIITQLGEWVLRTACAEAATWPDDIKVAVNVSPLQLTSNNAVQAVIGALAASGVPARRLELEITESVMMKNTFATLATLHQLHELDVQITLDDFGTGYSSLSHLLSFPFNKIKIDRCFINGLAEGDNARAIVRAVAGLATSLGMTTTAEGIETERQREIIRAAGCTEMQGDLFSPSRPAAEISRLFRSRAQGAECAA